MISRLSPIMYWPILYDKEMNNKRYAKKYYSKYIKSAPPEKQNSNLTYAKPYLKVLMNEFPSAWQRIYQ